MKLKFISTLILFISLATSVFANSSAGDMYYAEAQKANDKKDYSTAFKLLQEAAQNNSAKANEVLGQLYSFGVPMIEPKVNADTDLAVKYMSRAVELGDEDAKKVLISFQLKGWGDTSQEKIVQLRSNIEANLQNSTQDEIENLLNLVDSYLFIKQKNLIDINKAEYFANQLLKLDLNPSQKYQLAIACQVISVSYISGLNGLQKNPEKAFQWMKAAANLGLKEAYYELSDMYFYGYGTPGNFKMADEMKKLGDEKEWPRYQQEHKEHVYSAFLRPLVYLKLL